MRKAGPGWWSLGEKWEDDFLKRHPISSEAWPQRKSVACQSCWRMGPPGRSIAGPPSRVVKGGRIRAFFFFFEKMFFV